MGPNPTRLASLIKEGRHGKTRASEETSPTDRKVETSPNDRNLSLPFPVFGGSCHSLAVGSLQSLPASPYGLGLFSVSCPFLMRTLAVGIEGHPG